MASEESRATFVTDLKQEGSSGVKEQISELERLEGVLKNQNATLGKMQLQYRNLKVGGLQSSQAAKELKDRILAQKKAIGENALALGKQKGAFDVSTKSQKANVVATKQGTSALAGLAAGAKLGGGPIAALTSKSGTLAASLGKAGLVGVALAAAAALIALDYAAVKSAVSVATAAVTSANAYRTENIELQGLTKTWSKFWGVQTVAPGNADKMQAAINRVTSSVTLGRDKVIDLNSSLYSMRLRGQNLETALKAVALAESGAGEKGKQWAMGQIYMNAILGRSMDQVGVLAQKRFGGIVSAKMLDLNVQTLKAKENIAALFRGVKIEPLLKGLDKVLGFFKAGSVQAEAWSTIFETMFNPLFRGAEKGGDVIKTFMNKVTILALNAAIAWEDMGASFSLQKFGIKDTSDLLVKASTAAGGLAIAMLRAADATIYIVSGATRAYQAVAGLFGMAKALFTRDFGPEQAKAGHNALLEFKSAFGTNETADVGHSMIDGLIKGIQDAQPFLNKAAADAMKGAENAAKDEAKIRSPSHKWQMNVGRQLPLGGAIGIRQTAPVMARAGASALAGVGVRASGGGGFGMGAGGMGGGGMARPSVSVGEVHAHFHGAPNAAGTVTIPIAEFRSFLAQTIEGVAIQRGAHI